MASVAKWLRQWFVVPPFVGSIPIIRPFDFIVQMQARIVCADADRPRVRLSLKTFVSLVCIEV